MGDSELLDEAFAPAANCPSDDLAAKGKQALCPLGGREPAHHVLHDIQIS